MIIFTNYSYSLYFVVQSLVKCTTDLLLEEFTIIILSTSCVARRCTYGAAWVERGGLCKCSEFGPCAVRLHRGATPMDCVHSVCVHTRTLALADVGVPHASILLIVISLSSSLSHLLIMKFALITLLCY